MSTLSELIPSGGTQNNIEFVAQGTLANGQTVGLRSDGKVEAISSSSVTEQLGSAVVFENSSIDYTSATFDADNNKVVIAYQNPGGNYYGTAVVGTVSGTSISFGTPVFFESATIYYTSVTFDSNSNKVVIAYRDADNSNYGTAIVGTVSGTSISFGSAVVFATVSASYESIVFDSNSNKVVIAYRNGNAADSGTAIVGTVSGTSISFGSAVQFNAGTTGPISTTFDSNSNKVVIAYVDGANSSYGTAIVGTVSGTSISFGSEVVYEAANTNGSVSAVFDSSNNKVVIVYPDNGNSSYGTAVVGTVSGTSIGFGSPIVFESAYAYNISATFDSNANKVVVAYTDIGNSSYGTLAVGTVSGTSISFSSPSVFESASTDVSASTFDSNLNKVVIAYKDAGNSGYGTSVVFQNASTSTNVSSYIGITNAAISSGATGEVAVKGGLSTTAEVQDSPPTLGAQSTITTNGYYITSAYDSTTKNTVFQFYDANNSGYGTARVASISGTTITYGTPVVYDSTGNATWGVVAYDSNTNRIVIAYRGAPSYYPYAVVGTVSGTSISFGTPVAIENIMGTSMAISFDSSANKVVIAYRDNNGVGKVVVGTPSGTSISFGSIVQFASSVNNATLGLAYDSTNNKTVLVYADTSAIGKPTALVGTISGTSISFGSAVVISSDNVAHMSLTFDPSSGKVVVSYNTSSRSYVGTVSGTSISFGSVVTYNGGTSADVNYLTVDTVTNNVVLFFEDSATNGAYVYGTISGTSISWSTPADVNSVRISYGGISFNVDSKLTIMGYRQDSPLGGFVTPLSLSTLSEPFTIGSNYFVQDDGTLSTTSSSHKAGKAISTTALNLVDPT
jgi:hypothetical protein